MAATDLKKGKIAKRVIAVLEYFDDHPGYATVMDLVRAYDWPQSSTSELLASLVELGILYKDRPNRSFIPTQRAALLGAWNQPTFVRGGGLSELVIRMAEATGQPVAIVGMIGVSAQVFSWHAGSPRSLGAGNIQVGMTDQLTRTAPGWMLLGTKEISQRNRIVRRLNAESDSPFMPFAEMSAVIDATIVDGYAAGPLGLGSSSNCVALLVPEQPADRQIAICCETRAGDQADTSALLSRMQGVLAESGWFVSAPAGYGQLYKAA